MRRNSSAWELLAGASFFFLVLTSLSYAQVTFERTYGGPAYDMGECVQQTSDGGYVITGLGGWIESTNQGYVYLLKTDSEGDTLWAKTFGADSGVDWGLSVQQTLDGGYIVAGYTRELGPGLEDAYLIKTDSTGDTVWTRTYGGTDQDVAFSVQQTQDGGYVVVGATKSMGDSKGDVYLIKTDSQGDTLWTKTYGDSLPDAGHSIRQTSDGGYIITGMANYTNPPLTGDLYLVRTNAQGDALWARTYGSPGVWDQGESVQETSDGGYIVAGTAAYSPYALGFDRTYLVRTNSQGDSLWTRTYVHRDRSRGSSVSQTYDGGYVVVGTSMRSDGTSPLAYIVRTDSMGDTLWTRTYGSLARTRARSVRQTSDTGFVVVGQIQGFNTQLRDVYLVKMDDFGLTHPIRDVGVESIDAPDDTVFTDTWCEIVATIRSYTNVIDSAGATASIDGYAETVENFQLLPGGSLQVHFPNWFVPSADSTTYTMTVCARVPDDIDTTNDCMQKEIFAYNPTGVEEALNRPSATDFRLSQNKPNPFHRSTVIEYALPTQCDVTLSIYDVTGSLVGKLVDKRQGAGVFRVQWIAESHADGIYFCRLMACPERSPELGEGRSRRAGDFVETRKMVLVR